MGAQAPLDGGRQGPAQHGHHATLPSRTAGAMFGGMSEAKTKSFDVAVVGGGATGFAAALTAASCGFRVIQFAPPASFPPGRTAALLQGSIDILSDLGVWPALDRSAAPLKAIRLVDATHRLLRAPETTFYASEIGLPAFGYNVPNGALVDALRQRAEAVEGLRILGAPLQAVDLEDGDGQATLRTDDDSFSARLVVAADGARSVARQAAGIAVRTWRYPQAALVATLTVDLPHDGVSTEFHTETGPFTLVPLRPEGANNRVSLVWVDRASRARRALSLAEDAFARTVEKRAHFIHGSMHLDSQPALFPLSAALAKRFSGRRTMLVGEAAHLFPPIGAQGLNLGFRDVAALRRVLTRHRDDPGGAAALEAFHAMRQADVRSRTYAVDLLNRSLLTDFLPVQAARALGIGLAGSLPVIRRFLMREGIAGRSPARS
jgi:2-octaprenyl-6-methoxyphenol hydroxylase